MSFCVALLLKKMWLFSEHCDKLIVQKKKKTEKKNQFLELYRKLVEKKNPWNIWILWKYESTYRYRFAVSSQQLTYVHALYFFFSRAWNLEQSSIFSFFFFLSIICFSCNPSSIRVGFPSPFSHFLLGNPPLRPKLTLDPNPSVNTYIVEN